MLVFLPTWLTRRCSQLSRSNMKLQPCDIMFARSHGFLGGAIRFCTRRIGEGRTIASHTGLIVEPGEDMQATVVEALAHVKRHTLGSQYAACDTELCVFRPLNLTEEEKTAIVAKAETYVGREYGYFKLLLHLADFALDGAYVFRRLGRMDRYPICSYVVASAYKAGGKNFGVSDYAASPDDVWDFCLNHLEKYAFIWQRGSMYQPCKSAPLNPLNMTVCVT